MGAQGGMGCECKWERDGEGEKRRRGRTKKHTWLGTCDADDGQITCLSLDQNKAKEDGHRRCPMHIKEQYKSYVQSVRDSSMFVKHLLPSLKSSKMFTFD